MKNLLLTACLVFWASIANAGGGWLLIVPPDCDPVCHASKLDQRVKRLKPSQLTTPLEITWMVAPEMGFDKKPYSSYEINDTFETLKDCQNAKKKLIADAENFAKIEIAAIKASPGWGSWFLSEALNYRFFATMSMCVPSDSAFLKQK